MVLDRNQHSDPVHQISVGSRVFVTEFSPFEWSGNLLALGLANSVLIGQVKFPEEDDTSQLQEPEFEIVKEIHHDGRVQALAWSPNTSLIVAPRCISFATSGTDHKLRIFTTDSDDVNMNVLKGHTDYINSISFEPETGDHVLSCSDDHSAKLWNVESGLATHTLHLSSPGMMVSWHPVEMGKVVVAEKCGLISVVNSSNLAPIMSLDCCSSPLLSADWCLANSLLLSAVVGSDIVYFDLSRPSLPTEKRALQGDGGRIVRLSRSTDSLTAHVGKPGAVLRVTQHRAGQPLVSNQKKIIGGGLSWHLRLPYLAVGNNREVDIYKISV